jgi:hypothetical protein
MLKRLSIKGLMPAAGVSAALAIACLLPVAPVAAALASYAAYSYGGTLKSGPAAESASSTSANVFVHGTNDGLWQARFVSGAFTGWTSLGGTFILDPGAASAAATTDSFVAVEGLGGVTWTRYSIDNGATFGPWTSQGGVTIAGPAAAASFSGGVLRVDLFVVGSDGSIWTKTSADGTSFPTWSHLGTGVVTEKPGAVAWNTGVVTLFVRGTDMGLWTITFTGGVPGPWTSLGGTLLSGVAATSCAPGLMDIYVVGTGGALWHRGYNTGWQPWDQNGLGGTWTSNLGAECQAGTKVVTVFGKGTDNALWSWNAPGS